MGMGDTLEDRVRALEVRMAMVEQRADTMSQDIREIKDGVVWLQRLVIGAVVIGVLNLVMKVSA
jgi:Haemolysin XhlA.